MRIQDIKTGTKISLEIFNDYDEKIRGNFISQFEAIKDHKRIIIYAPILKGEVYPVRLGWTINAIFLQDENIYRLQAKVRKRFVVNDISFIEAEATGEIERIQRREYYRLPCFIPVKYRIFSPANEKKEIHYKECIAINISGGGLGLKVNEKLNIDDIIECKMIIDNREFNPICQVVRIDSEDNALDTGYIIGVKFIKISKADVDKIISFIFKEQVELIRKGLI